MNSPNSKDWILWVYQTQRLKRNQLVTTNLRTFAAKAESTTLRLKTDSLTFCPQFKRMALFSTNPYNNFQAANLKEYIPLDKGAKQDFRPKNRFNIILTWAVY